MLNETQLSYMTEECILVNDRDEIIGHLDKKTCHLASAIAKDDLLHRAFSVFLFNSQGQLLLQRRANEKITFPDCWTNTCCSHPLFGGSEVDGINGAKLAAVRKLQHELGITDIAVGDLRFVARIHYKALQKDDVWAEHEIDYILFVQKDVKWELNLNEVSDVRFVDPHQLRELIDASSREGISPWFRLICEKFFFDWWGQLNKIVGSSEDQKDQEIHRLGTHC